MPKTAEPRYKVYPSKGDLPDDLHKVDAYENNFHYGNRACQRSTVDTPCFFSSDQAWTRIGPGKNGATAQSLMVSQFGVFPFARIVSHQAYMSRRIKVAQDMWDLMGVQREDQAARAKALVENFRFWGAPVGMVVTVDRAWMASCVFLYGEMQPEGNAKRYIMRACATGV